MRGMLHPELLHLVPLFPCVVGLAMLLWARRRRQAAEALGDAGLVRRLAPTDLAAAPNLRIALVTGAALLLGIAAVGPLWGVEETRETRGGMDVVLVLDASNSMRVEDVDPSRLEWERVAARELLEALRGSRIGLVVFAGRGYLVSPLTDDHSALELYLEGLSPDVLSQGGSTLSDAIVQGVTVVYPGTGGAPAGSVVVLTDGDALEEKDEVLRAAGLAARAGVPVHAVGIGTARGGPVPDLDPVSGERKGFKREPTGEVAVSRLDPELLRDVARRTGGTYQRLANPTQVQGIVSALRRTPGRGGARTGTAPGNRYEWFVGGALLLLVIDVLLADRAARRPSALAAGGAR